MGIKSKAGVQGRYRITKTNAQTGEKIYQSAWIDNLVMKNENGGVNLVARHLAGDTPPSLDIVNAKIGTGTTPAADSDTDLETTVLGTIPTASKTRTNNVVNLTFFITDASLPNGTYTEFGVFNATKIFTRSIITPSIEKGTNENLNIEYEITINN